MKIPNLLAATLLAVGLATTGSASAVGVGFSNITHNNEIDLSSQLIMETSVDGGSVFFTFSNNIGIGSSITDIYFDLGTASSFTLGNMTISAQSAGVDFSMGAKPGDVPSGTNIGFSADTGLTADSNPPAKPNGIDALNESLTISAVLTSGTYDALLRDLRSGMFRVAMHVQGIAGGGNNDSDSYVSTTVPLPAAAWLFGSALLGFVSFSVRRKA